MKKLNCEDCIHFAYDDDCECYVCQMSLDEDEMLRFLQGNYADCPYFRSGDDYAVVRKQN
jgi:hypothetical protein